LGHNKSIEGIVLMFDTFSINKKDCSSRDEKAFQILAIVSHATFVYK
jgi:hypothetical protein